MEIKTCPFCGGEAKIEEFYFDRPYYWVECSNCGACTAQDDREENFEKEEAIEAWNRRIE